MYDSFLSKYVHVYSIARFRAFVSALQNIAILEAKVTTFISRLCYLTTIQTDNYFTASLWP